MNDKDNLIFNELVVVKRSGQRVNFNSMKIAIAIKKAFDNTGLEDCEKKVNKVYEDVLSYIRNNYWDRKTINVEDIQDIIQTMLLDDNYEDVYKAFSDYRIRRAASRKAFDIKSQHKFVKAIERIVFESKKNITSKPNEVLLDFGKTVSCEYTKAYVLDNKFIRAHEDGSVYIHNLDYFNLGSLSSTHLEFNSVITDEFPLNIFCTAMNAKNEIDGEITISKIDYLLVPFLLRRFREKFKEKLNKYLDLEGYLDYINFKKIEELIDKEDVINIDLDIFNQYILNKKVRNIFEIAYADSVKKIEELLTVSLERLLVSLNNIITENKKYAISLGTNNTKIGLMINNCYLDVVDKLDSMKNVTTIFKIKKNGDNCLFDRVSELVIKGKNIVFANLDASYNKDKDNEVEYFSNGKRIFENILCDEKNSIGRMIVASVSINMSRLGNRNSDKTKSEFYLELDEMLELTKNILIMIFETIGNKSKENYQVIFNNNILDDDKLESGQKIRKVIKKGVLNIELASLSECAMCLEKDKEKQKKLVKEIIDYVNGQAKKYSIENKLNFVVSETSKERPLKKLIAFDKAIYGIKKDVTDKNCYLRIDSMFNFKENIKNDFKYIGEYQMSFTGGNLVNVYLPKNITVKKFNELLELMIECNVGFLRFSMRK